MSFWDNDVTQSPFLCPVLVTVAPLKTPDTTHTHSAPTGCCAGTRLVWCLGAGFGDVCVCVCERDRERQGRSGALTEYTSLTSPTGPDGD